MFELIKLAENTWYMPAPTNVGFWLYAENEVCLIDCGDRTTAGAALENAAAHGWKITKLFLTHSHTDHTSGAAWLREQTGCEVYAPGISAAAVKHSFLIATTLYGGHPSPDMCSKFLLPPPCECAELAPADMPAGLEALRLDGHDMAQAAYRTADNIWFTADAVISASALSKHRISFIYDIETHLDSLERLAQTDGEVFVPSHDQPCSDIRPLVRENISAVQDVSRDILEWCREPKTIDELISLALEKYNIRLYLMQYLLVGQTVRSYVSWLQEHEKLAAVYEGTRLLFRTAY